MWPGKSSRKYSNKPRELFEKNQMPEAKLNESELRNLIERLLVRFGDSIEFWTIACLTQQDLGNPRQFIAEQWDSLSRTVQELRNQIATLNSSAHPALNEQLAKLGMATADLQNIFDVLANYREVPIQELEAVIHKLNILWSDWKNRLTLISALVPLRAPLPGLSSEQEVFYQHALDSLFDRFYSSRQTHAPSQIYRS